MASNKMYDVYEHRLLQWSTNLLAKNPEIQIRQEQLHLRHSF